MSPLGWPRTRYTWHGPSSDPVLLEENQNYAVRINLFKLYDTLFQVIHVGDTDWVPGSWLQPDHPWLLKVSGNWPRMGIQINISATGQPSHEAGWDGHSPYWSVSICVLAQLWIPAVCHHAYWEAASHDSSSWVPTTDLRDLNWVPGPCPLAPSSWPLAPSSWFQSGPGLAVVGIWMVSLVGTLFM